VGQAGPSRRSGQDAGRVRRAFAAGGPYAVSPGEEFAVRLETRTGRSWVLTQSVTGSSVWLPIQRIETDDEARVWKDREAKLKKASEKTRPEASKHEEKK
jgi:hypothetical protein